MPGDRVDVTVTAHHDADPDSELTATAHHDADPDSELTATRMVVLTGDLDDVVRFGVGPGWEQVAGVDAGELPREPT
ncbi:MAG: hypothetical protein M3Q22_11750, partial [Actinomycetota bacterium]|nr:hypothetical protein [Actinomycetota bacterium]